MGTGPSSRTALSGCLVAAVAAASCLAASPVLAADHDPPMPTQEQVDDARADVSSTAASVGQIQAQLAVAREQLSTVMIEAAQKAEAYNGARYRLQQARDAAEAAQQRADVAAAEVERQRDQLESFAVGTATDASDMTQLRTVLSSGGPRQLLSKYGAWSSTTNALQVDLDTWDAAQTVAGVLQDDADDAVERQHAAAGEARAARAAAQEAVEYAQSQQVALEAETDRLVSELARLQDISVSLAEQRQTALAERAAEQAAAEQAAREAAARRAAAQAAQEQAAQEAQEQTDSAGSGNNENGGSDGSNGGSNPPAPDPAPAPAPTPTPTPTPAPTPDPPAPTPPSPNPPAPSGGAQAAIAFAKAQLGEPYVWGAAGPDSWDCSGLTMGAWAAAGEYLPHYSVAQYDATTPISAGSLRPGDLLFWSSAGSPSSIYHVAMYLGNGMMIQAPRTGRNVEIVSMYYWTAPDLFSRV